MVAESQLKQAEEKMRKAIEVARDEFGGLRTGRASPTLVEKIDVDYYGTKTPLNQIAGISVPEARVLMISPYDRTALGAIEKAILASELGITPNSDGNVIRLVFPQLTEERRRELIKVLHQRAEDGRVSIRNIRRHTKEELEKMEKDGVISEDDLKRSEKDLQKTTDQFIGEIEDMVGNKEKELLEV